MVEPNIKNILAADCGSATTTAVLIDRVEGEYRLVATGQTASTHDTPWHDITLGVVKAVRQIEKVINRTLLSPGGWPITPQHNNQQGVDVFVVVSSAGPPLSLTLVGLMQDITLASARRAAATTYTCITNVLSLDAGPNTTPSGPHRNGWHSTEAQIQAIQASQPEVILLVGGTDGGAERPVIEMANVISMAVQVLKGADKPVILYAGNRTVRTQVAEILGPVGTLKAVDNVRPTLAAENLAAVQMELESLYIQRKMFRLPGLEKLSNWSKYPILPASKSFEKVIAYIGRHNQLNVIGVNIGSGATIVSTQTRAHHGSTIRSDAGVGHSLASLLKVVPIEKFHRWLPFPLDPEELYNQLLNKSLHPTSIPTTYEDLMIEHTVAREALRLVVEQARANWPPQSPTGRQGVQWNLMIGAGRPLTRTPHPGYAAMIMLDGIQPWGVTSLALDVSGTANMLGSIAAIEPRAAVEVAIRDTFLNLGTVVAPIGHSVAGQTALKLKINYHTAPQELDSHPEKTNGDGQEINVAYGSIEVIPLSPGKKATLEIRPTRHFDIGLGQPGRGAVAEVEGGILGIIIDARGRPLRLPQDDTRRQALLAQWLSKLDIPHATARKND